jgi:hypothetical protein
VITREGDGRLVERRHAFWRVDCKVEIKRLDLRPQAVEIAAQERGLGGPRGSQGGFGR